jgi:ESS family glutamate:Na+ symporter
LNLPLPPGALTLLTHLLAGLPSFALAMVLLVVLLTIGTALARGVGVHQWGIPEALIAGSLGLLLAPGGALPLLPPAVIDLWEQLPLVLLTLVFGSLLVGKPLPKPAGLWRPLSAQVLLALSLAFGQFFVAGLTVLLVLQPLLHVSPVLACLIEVAFEGGHGSAAAMGPTYERLGVEGGTELGLAMATVGLLASTLVGGLVVVLARRLGWLEVAPASPAAAEPGSAEAAPADRAPWAGLSMWLVNLALAGIAVAIGWVLLELLRMLAERVGGGFAVVIDALPVFPLALIGSLLVRLALERSGQAGRVSTPMQARIGTVSADLLIVAATACLDLSLLARDWLPLAALALGGLAWNLAVVLLLGRRILPAPWFQRGIIEFGQATGVAASGLLLLSMADPHDSGDAITPFSIKQLLLQPLLAGGVITVVAPLAVNGWGLPAWTGCCAGLVLIWGVLGLWLAKAASP